MFLLGSSAAKTSESPLAEDSNRFRAVLLAISGLVY